MAAMKSSLPVLLLISTSLAAAPQPKFRAQTIDDKIQIDLAASDTTADVVEQRIRTWLLKLPGSR